MGCVAVTFDAATSDTVPEKRDSSAVRSREGSRGGRPPGFDTDHQHKKGNAVEWAMNKLRQMRAVATRYDKCGYVYLGTVTVAALTTCLRIGLLVILLNQRW